MEKTISVLLAFLMILPLTAFSAFAVDYPSNWAREEVEAAEAEGLITEAVKKDYHKNITREEFCELVVKLYEKITGEKAIAGVDVFVDTNNTEILKAYSLGIVNGISKDEFAPSNFITRQEICAMLVRCIDVSIDGADIRVFNTYDFVDKRKIANWAIDNVYYAYQHGIMRGVGNNSIAPLDNTTCEQAILLVHRVFAGRNVLREKTDVAYETDISHIETDDTTNISYVNNIVLIFFKDTATKEDEERVVEAINGNVVGRFETINQIQVQVDKSSLEELIAICDRVEGFDAVLSATYDVAMQIDTNAITVPNDKWDNDDWNESLPSGNNWWLEAIQAPSAWNYNKNFQNIKIGIVDDGFDADHEDLKGKISFPNDVYAGGNNNEDHGTHVAGIIGANANNKKGITGIVWNSELICFDWKPSWFQKMMGGWDTSTFVAAGLIETVKSGAKAINFSLGTSGNLPNHKSSYSQEQVNAFGNTASMYMAGLLYQGYDFVVVQSAGNGAADEISVDAINNGWFSSITKDNCFSALGNVDEVLNRIIIVGAAQQDGSSYIQAKFSNGGNQVDICAPGVDIYSTVTGGISGKYTKLKGTSMAAPIVTGVCALTWSADKSLTGPEVKEIVCTNTKDTVRANSDTNSTRSYPMVNAKLAVERALHISGSVSGKVVDSTTNKPISGVRVYLNCIFDEGGEDIGTTCTTGEDGTFLLEIPENITGVTKVEFEKDGYKEGSYLLEGSNITSYNIGTYQMDSLTDPEVLYQDVLSDYSNALSYLHNTGADFYFYEMYDAMEIYPLVRCLPSYPKESIYYAFHDIDKNGVPELVIGLQTTTGKILVEDIFCHKKNGSVHLLPPGSCLVGGPSTPSKVYENGDIISEMHSTIDDFLFVKYRISAVGYTYEEKENVGAIWSYAPGDGIWSFYKNCEISYNGESGSVEYCGNNIIDGGIGFYGASTEPISEDYFYQWTDGMYYLNTPCSGMHGAEVQFNWMKL